MVENYSWYGAESPQALAWSDANRELDHLDRYSGMGGFCSQTQIWWHYQFSEEEVLVLPMRVTKMWAELVTATLNGVECSGLRYLEYVDNEAVELVIQGQSTKDPRLHGMLLLRDSSNRGNALKPEDWISRGDFESFK